MLLSTQVDTARLPAASKGRFFFLVAALVLLGLTLVAFSDNLFTDVGQASNHDPKFIVHGLFCGAWIIVLVAQTLLVSSRNVRLHRKLGVAALLIAVGVTLSTIWVFWAVWKGWAAMSPDVKANRLLLPSYSLFIAMGYLNRRRADWHKRFIYTGTLFMLDPVLGRVYDPLLVPFMTGLTEKQIDAAFLPIILAIWLGFFAALFVYDAVVIRRIHRVTMGALTWFAAAWTVAFVS